MVTPCGSSIAPATDCGSSSSTVRSAARPLPSFSGSSLATHWTRKPIPESNCEAIDFGAASESFSANPKCKPTTSCCLPTFEEIRGSRHDDVTGHFRSMDDGLDADRINIPLWMVPSRIVEHLVRNDLACGSTFRFHPLLLFGESASKWSGSLSSCRSSFPVSTWLKFPQAFFQARGTTEIDRQ